MNWENVAAEWNDFKGRVKSKWGKLTDDDLMLIAGKKDQLLARIQNRYGFKKDEAEKQVDSFINSIL